MRKITISTITSNVRDEVYGLESENVSFKRYPYMLEIGRSAGRSLKSFSNYALKDDIGYVGVDIGFETEEYMCDSNAVDINISMRDGHLMPIKTIHVSRFEIKTPDYNCGRVSYAYITLHAPILPF